MPGAVSCLWCDVIARVRADEVERRFGWVAQADARAWFLTDLRAKVEGLRDSPADLSRFGWRQGVADVLALIDELATP
jgi:hypothetical protein